MKIDVIIPLSGYVRVSIPDRTESLNAALRHFYGTQSGCDVRVILVEQVTDGKVRYLENIDGNHCEVKKIACEYPVFNKNWCLNIGVNQSESDPFLLADADMFTRESYFAHMVDMMTAKGKLWGFAWNQLHYTQSPHAKRRVINGDPLTGVLRWDHPRHGYSEGGVTVWTRRLWEQIGGANEFFEAVGGMDNELAWRAWRASGQYWKYPQKIFHLIHAQKPKKDHPQRITNIVRLRVTRQRPGKVNNFLKSCNQGDIKAPAIARHKWNV